MVSAANPQMVPRADLPNQYAEDASTAADKQWISHTFSCLFLELSLGLCLYGLEAQPSATSQGQTPQTVALAPAADAAVAAFIKDACGASAVFLVTIPSSSGVAR